VQGGSSQCGSAGIFRGVVRLGWVGSELGQWEAVESGRRRRGANGGRGSTARRAQVESCRS
jgi:hypothetical protein